MAPIAQARPDAHVFMQSHMVISEGQASSFVLITKEYLFFHHAIRAGRGLISNMYSLEIMALAVTKIPFLEPHEYSKTGFLD